MRKITDKEEKSTTHSIRVRDRDWEYFIKLKPQDKSWSLFLRELTETIIKIKQL